jgi:hypothetical protein
MKPAVADSRRHFDQRFWDHRAILRALFPTERPAAFFRDDPSRAPIMKVPSVIVPEKLPTK